MTHYCRWESVKQECIAAREEVALFDMSFSKYFVEVWHFVAEEIPQIK